MGTHWCAKFPVVTVPLVTDPKALTYVVPFYENQGFFSWQLRHWQAIGPFRSLSYVVVDDGSPVPAEITVDVPRLRLFRIEQDVRWNWLAARNIGAHEAGDGWLFLTDMDHVVPRETLQAMLYGNHNPGVIYGFSRREHTGEVLTPHPNSWLMTKAMFWKVGGYDENLSGHYGTDGDWRRRCAAVAPIQILADELHRYEYQQDSSTVRYQRKQPEDAGVRAIIAARPPKWRPKTLSFPYHEVREPLTEVACL